MANSLDQTQIYAILNSIAAQATGRNDLAAVDSSSFVSVAQTTLLSGYDNVIGAISQVLSKTIFSVRPYSRKFKGLETDAIRFGNHVRKLAISDKEWESDERLPLEDDGSVDQWKINKPNVLQTNFYGQSVYQRHYTIYKDQLDVALSSEADFARFIVMVVSNCSDIIEQAHESLARMTIVNAIAGVLALEIPEQTIHLLSEYNDLTGLSLTDTTLYQPQNYKPFIEYCYSRINSISELLTERSTLYHNNIEGKEVSRHTPREMQRAYIWTPNRSMIDASVYANTFRPEYLQSINAESVNYWQSIKNPAEINVTASYTDNTGKVATKAITANKIFAFISDEEMCGYTTVNQWSQQTPMNAAGGYYNVFFHFTDRYYVDNFENAALFMLD